LVAPLLILGTLLVIALLLAVAAGSTSVPLRAALAGDATARAILFQLRVPRALLAALIGATLAVAGLTFQTLLRNPLADPFLRGDPHLLRAVAAERLDRGAAMDDGDAVRRDMERRRAAGSAARNRDARSRSDGERSAHARLR